MPSFFSNNTTHVEQPDLFSFDFPSTKELTVLSYGAGQESTWLLYKTILDKDSRQEDLWLLAQTPAMSMMILDPLLL
jgi:hypothetical protein